MAATVSELLWMSYVIKDLNISIEYPIQMFCDNQTTIHILENPVLHNRTKHIGIDYHFLRDHYIRGFIKPMHISSTHQIADLFTRAVGIQNFLSLLVKLNLGFSQAHLEGGLLKNEQINCCIHMINCEKRIGVTEVSAMTKFTEENDQADTDSSGNFGDEK